MGSEGRYLAVLIHPDSMYRKRHKKILLNSESEATVKAPVKMGRPVNEEEKTKRENEKRLHDEEKKKKKELWLEAKIKSARRGRGSPKRDPLIPKPIVKRDRSKKYSFEPDPPKNIVRPPAVYDNTSPYDKYQL